MADHQSYSQKFSFTFPILSDPEATVSKAYEARGLIWIKRTVVGIGPDGTIVYYKHGMPANEEIIAAFKGK